MAIAGVIAAGVAASSWHRRLTSQLVRSSHMRYARLLVALSGFYCLALSAADQRAPILNPAIDVGAYLRVASDAAQHRESRRLSEDDFIRLSRESGTIVLDARSKEKYTELHVKGALNLSFPDIAIASLEQMLPDKSIRILIYCNNNFTNAEGPFPSKLPSASLNLPTYIALYDYGYRNVYELGPLIDARQTRIEFESSLSTP
jgi:phage shock protein E